VTLVGGVPGPRGDPCQVHPCFLTLRVPDQYSPYRVKLCKNDDILFTGFTAVAPYTLVQLHLSQTIWILRWLYQ